MLRVALAARVISAGLIGVGLMLATPVMAQAGGSAVPHGEIWWFSGYTYPDTSAGYSACVAEGEYEHAHGGVATWSCRLGDPDAGVYNLWLADIT